MSFLNASVLQFHLPLAVFIKRYKTSIKLRAINAIIKYMVKQIITTTQLHCYFLTTTHS